MIQPILFAFVAVLSSFGAVNGAIVQRDGLFVSGSDSYSEDVGTDAIVNADRLDTQSTLANA